MKKQATKLFDKVILKVLTLLGCAGLFAACYGTVESAYEVIRGTVTDIETDEPIEGIQVTIKVGKYPLDTIYTDKDGRYSLYWGGLDSMRVKVEDIDGEENGGLYAPDSTFVNRNDTTDQGRYSYYREVDFSLKRQGDNKEK